MALVNETLLNGYLGKNISEICSNHYDQADNNHCAHFVSHVLNIESGFTCKAATSGVNPGANLRVQEVFARCLAVGRWEDRPMPLLWGLVFVTAVSNVHLKAKMMDNIPKKHIGIYINQTIWHYSNANHKVITQTPAEFVKHYSVPNQALFYGQWMP